MAATKTDWFFIVNPRAGSGKTMSKWVPAERKLDSLGISYETALTDHKRHATELAYEAASKGYRKIVAVGGDGSLHETLVGIANFCDNEGVPTEDFYLGVVPIGSGNDWIKSFKVPNDANDVIDLLAKESFTQMDVVTVNSRDGKKSYMANVGGVGFDSQVCVRVNTQKEMGMRNKKIYYKALLHTIANLKTTNVKVIADNVSVFEGICYSIALGNGKYSGGGMRQVPLADYNDDALDYAIIPKLPLTTIASQIHRLFNGTLNESKHIISGRCKSLSIIPLDEDSATVFEIDGEIEGRIPMSVEMKNRKINVLKG